MEQIYIPAYVYMCTLSIEIHVCLCADIRVHVCVTVATRREIYREVEQLTVCLRNRKVSNLTPVVKIPQGKEMKRFHVILCVMKAGKEPECLMISESLSKLGCVRGIFSRVSLQLLLYCFDN